MIRQELALKLAASGCMRRWDPQVQVVYDDTRAPACSYIDARIRRYDRRLFVRFNALAERWELFRWHGNDAPRRAALRAIPAEEVARRSMYLWTIQEEDGGYAEPLARTLRKIQLGDTFAKCGSSSAEALERQMRAEERAEAEMERADREEAAAEMGEFFANQIRAQTGRRLIYSHAR